MNNLTKLFFLTAIAVLFITGDLDEVTQFGFAKLGISVIQDAQARVGRPLTPVSVGGVRRRTRRRTAVVTAAVVTRPVVVGAPVIVGTPVVVGAPVVVETPVVVGTSYTALPAGCTTIPYAGITYYNCDGIYYKPAFQGDSVIYTVVENP